MISCIKTDDDDDDDFNLLLETNILVGLKRIMTRTANLRNLLENLLRCSLCSSPVTRSAFSSETSLFLFAEAYLISNSNIFYKTDIISSRWHPWWEHDVLTCQWQVNYWRTDWWHQRHVSRLRHPFPSTDYPLVCFARQFFLPFPPNAEPGPRLPCTYSVPCYTG